MVKMRSNFVSNSSSSSFIILKTGNENTFDAFVEDMIKVLESSDIGDYWGMDTTPNMVHLSSGEDNYLPVELDAIFTKYGIEIEWSGC